MRDRHFFYRAREGQGLSDDELRHWAPSIFASAPHGSRSERYAMIPTSQVLGGLRDNGFVPVYVQQQKSRSEDRRGFAKHVIRLRHRDAMDGHAIAREHRRLGMVFPEVTLLNSHDGSSQYSLRAGLLRLICLNGMVAQGEEMAPVVVGHWGTGVTDKVIEGSFRVLGESIRALTAAERWADLNLDREAQIRFAERAHVLRFGEEDTAAHPIAPAKLLAARRTDDQGTDLWRTFNRVQENAMAGGLRGHHRVDGRLRNVSTREIHGIDQSVKFNVQLWQLGEATAKELA